MAAQTCERVDHGPVKKLPMLENLTEGCGIRAVCTLGVAYAQPPSCLPVLDLQLDRARVLTVRRMGFAGRTPLAEFDHSAQAFEDKASGVMMRCCSKSAAMGTSRDAVVGGGNSDAIERYGGGDVEVAVIEGLAEE